MSPRFWCACCLHSTESADVRANLTRQSERCGALEVAGELPSLRMLKSEAARGHGLACLQCDWLSVHEGLIDEPFEHLAVIRADRARRLGHVDADDLLFGIDPEIGAGVTSPHEFAGRARHAGNPVALAHGKAKPERIAGCSQQKLARLKRRCDALPRWSDVISLMVERLTTRAPSS